MNSAKKAELALQVDEAEWEWLRPLLERDILILVSPDLELAEVGAKLAEDNSAFVAQWIEAKKVGKPSVKQVLDWDLTKRKKFRMLVVSPYALIQEM